MKISEVLRHYETFTGSLSAVNRQLAFAGIAVVWVLVVPHPNNAIDITGKYLFPLACFVIAMACDLLHYVVASASWGIYHWRHDTNVNRELDIPVPSYINWIPLFFFWTKVVGTLTGYVALFHAIVS